MNNPVAIIAGTPIRGENKYHVGEETAQEIVRLLREAGYVIVRGTERTSTR